MSCTNIKDDRNISSLLYYTTIPTYRNAQCLQPNTKTRRWPVMMFLHGLGGSRNGYSHIVGSLASHGIVVIAPEHRDGSVPRTYVGGPKGKAVDYRHIAHTRTKEVEDARDEQLEIRLWELGLIHDALLKIDGGDNVSNIVSDAKNDADLSMFASNLDVHTPGAISWAGHSMGATTVVQFVKSVFYRPSESTPSSYRPLYRPRDDSAIVRQITPSSTVNLLDLWYLPLGNASKQWLWDKPLPCYSSGGPGGSNVLAVLSEAFFKWRANMIQVKRAVSEDPSKEHSSFQHKQTSPYIFYPATSAHLSQSDFGVLFPWITKKALKAQEPERTLRLNVRAMLEILRQNGTEVADTSTVDMEEVAVCNSHITSDAHGNGSSKAKMNGHANGKAEPSSRSPGQDQKILSKDGSVRGWVAVNVDEEDQKQAGEGLNTETKVDASPTDAVLEGET